MQESQIASISSVVENAKQEIVKSMVANIDSDNIEVASVMISDISTLNRIMELLGVQGKKSPRRGRKPKNVSKVSTNESDGNKPHRVRRRKNSVYISEDMRSKRPVAVTVNGNRFEVSSFRDMTKTVCEYMLETNPKAFLKLEDNDDVNGSEHKYFSNSETDGMNDPVEICSSNGNSCFVDIAKLSMNNLLFLRKMLTALGVDEKSVQIEIDPNYQRKPRTKKVQ